MSDPEQVSDPERDPEVTSVTPASIGESDTPTSVRATSGQATPTSAPAAPSAAPQRRPANWGSQPLGLWWILPVGLTLGLIVLFAGEVRGFGYVVAGTLVVAALARLALPRSAVGGLLVRSRAWDVMTLLGLAAGVTIISATLLIR